MFRFLIDTCVWLDLAKDADLRPLLSALEELVQTQEVSLILPQTVVDEFQRNKKRVTEDACRSLSGVFKRVKDAVDKFGNPKEKQSVLEHLNEIDHQIPVLGESAVDAIHRIEHLMAGATVIHTSGSLKLRAADRAISRKAPFHRNRNGMGDAIILETYIDSLQDTQSKGIRFAFITHNTEDFSEPHGDKRLPHPDIAGLFTRVKSLYFVRLGEALSRVDHRLVGGIQAEEEWIQEPRRPSEIVKATDQLLDKIWYGRHGLLAHGVMSGKVRVVDVDAYPTGKYDPTLVRRDIWEGARAAAKRVENTYGVNNLGPWDEFEWGMLNGKLSALRWVLGDEWDMLDT